MSISLTHLLCLQSFHFIPIRLLLPLSSHLHVIVVLWWRWLLSARLLLLLPLPLLLMLMLLLLPQRFIWCFQQTQISHCGGSQSQRQRQQQQPRSRWRTARRTIDNRLVSKTHLLLIPIHLELLLWSLICRNPRLS